MVDIVLDRKNLYIIGAGGLGREIENSLLSISETERDWQLKGFLHEYVDESPLINYPSTLQILGGWRDYKFTDNDYCIIGTGDCEWRKKTYNSLKNRVNIYTFIHPSSYVYMFTNIGEGTVIMANCFISTNIEIGKACFVNVGTQIGHDVKVGNFTSIMSQVEIGGWCELGEKVFVGSKATVISKRKICNETIVGAGSVVVRNISHPQTVFGNPAERLI